MSEGKGWKSPAAIIGLATVLVAAVGVYISKIGTNLQLEQQTHQVQVDVRAEAETQKKQVDIQNRISELNRQLQESMKQVQDSEDKIQKTYRQIQEFDEKQNDASASDADKAEDHKSYLIFRENLEIFSKAKREHAARVEELQKEINNLTK